MNNTVLALSRFLEQEMARRIEGNLQGRVQPVLAGPPHSVLEMLYADLTGGGTREWTIALPDAPREVVVLLIEPRVVSGVGNGSVLSAKCKWDYAVSIRNSKQYSLTLVSPLALDSVQESIAHATETIGGMPRETRRWKPAGSWWNFFAEHVEKATSASTGSTKEVLNIVGASLAKAGRGPDSDALWEIANDMLGAQDGSDIVRLGGLLSLGSDPLEPDALRKSNKTLWNFSAKCSDLGLTDAENQLCGVATPAQQKHVSALFAHIRSKVGFGAGFNTSPHLYLRPPKGTAWWDNLCYRDIQELLDKVDGSTSRSPIEVTCTNAINANDRAKSEPYIVLSDVKIEINVPGKPHGHGPIDIERLVGRSAPINLGGKYSGDTLNDAAVPQHDKPIKYKASGSNLKEGSMSVISLASYDLKGIARIPEASKNKITKASNKPGEASQEITLSHSGLHDLHVYAVPEAVTLELEYKTPNGSGSKQSATPSSGVFVLPIQIDEEELLSIRLLNAGGTQISTWCISCGVQDEPGNQPRSRYEALVVAHQKHRARPSPPMAIECVVRQIEQSFLKNRVSWRGVIACWSDPEHVTGLIDWNDASLGDINFDARIIPGARSTVPPTAYLDAREKLRQQLDQTGKPIAEQRLLESSIPQLVDEYLERYLEWMQSAPESAAWTDCIAIYGVARSGRGGTKSPTAEPIVVALSPLHPVRIAWHRYAQELLETSLARYCPAAGLLDPHGSPSILALPLHPGSGGQGGTWRSFVATVCDDMHWSLLWNSKYLNESPERRAMLEVLGKLGFSTSGVVGGFTPNQVRRALGDMGRVLPVRTLLKIGLVGDSQESDKCARGILEWCEESLGVNNEENRSARTSCNPATCEIFDFRDEAIYPTPTGLAILAEQTGEATRWFTPNPGSRQSKIDLALVDHIGAHELGMVAGSFRAPLATGALYRIKIRSDLYGGVEMHEARIGVSADASAGLAGNLLRSVVQLENLSLRDANSSQLSYRPNQGAISGWLGNATFVAVTSSQIDPGNLVRGMEPGNGYLWDYELPGVMGHDDERAGYYLVAKPLPSMKQAIEQTTRLVSSNPPSVEDLLNEISRRGIPVLKKLSVGGSLSRGELGVLLAVRLLQDAFRPNPLVASLPVAQDGNLHLLLPVDSYMEPLLSIRKSLGEHGLLREETREFPDILVFSVKMHDHSAVEICITPLEIKYRAQEMPLLELVGALSQASSLGDVLDLLWNPASALPSELWKLCSRALFGQCLDHAFRIYADKRVHGVTDDQWSQYHQRILADVLAGSAKVTVNRRGRLLAFDSCSSSTIQDIDQDGREDTATISAQDADYLLSGNGVLSTQASQVVERLGFSSCTSGNGTGVASDGSITIPSSAGELGGDMPAGAIETPVEEQTEDTVTVGDTESSDQGDTYGEPLEPASTGSTVPPEYRRQVRAAFEGFVGNGPAVSRISRDLLRALIDKPPHLSKNYLFTGNPSTGKTELSRRIAKALGLPSVKLDGRRLTNREELFKLIDAELEHHGLRPKENGRRSGLPVFDYPPLVVFVDEAHLVSRVVQESLLTMLESSDRTVMLSYKVAQMKQATFMFATTRGSSMDQAFRTRCTEVSLRDYNVTEVAAMLQLRFPGHKWDKDVYLQLAKYGRAIPRMAIDLATELETEITVSEYPDRTPLQHLDEVRRAHEMDELGLKPIDDSYLNLLQQERKPMGADKIIRILAVVDKDQITDEVEPFLNRLGFIRFTQQGREITRAGIEYLTKKK